MRSQDVETAASGGKVAAATSSTSLYDNMGAGGSGGGAGAKQGMNVRQVQTTLSGGPGGPGAGAGTTATQTSRGTQDSQGPGAGATPVPAARERATQDSATMTTTQKVCPTSVSSQAQTDFTGGESVRVLRAAGG